MMSQATVDSPQGKKKLRLLCLHGFGTNREFMQMQTQALAAELEDFTELVHIDAPYIVPQELVFDRVVFKYLKGSPRSWFGPKLSIRLSEVGKGRTLEETLSNLEEIRMAIEKQGVNFDGAICFSQGTMAFQLIYLYHRLGHINWESFRNIKFLMNFSSVSARISLGWVGWQRFAMPSLHIISQEDIFFQTMMVTPTRFKNPQIIFHTFGHKFPALGLSEKRTIVAFMKKYGYGKNTFDISKESKL